MNERQIDHIALAVESVRQAENFYARLFDLQPTSSVGSASGCGPESGGTDSREDSDGGRAASRSCLARGEFRIVLHAAATDSAGPGRLAHIGLRVPRGDLAGIAARARDLGCDVTQAPDGAVELTDPYAVRWLIAPMAGPRGQGAPIAEIRSSYGRSQPPGRR